MTSVSKSEKVFFFVVSWELSCMLALSLIIFFYGVVM